jgi:hypothetical protein
MILILVLWLVAILGVTLAMGPLESTESVPPVPPLAQLEPLPEPEPEPQPEPAPAPNPDELADFQPCPTESQPTRGSAYFTDWRAHYDQRGRFVILATYRGELGQILVRQDLSSERPVTALDLAGLHRLDRSSLDAEGGPVRGVKLGQHQGFIRIAVNYLHPPQRAEAEILCQSDGAGGVLAARLTLAANPGQAQTLTQAASLALARDY